MYHLHPGRFAEAELDDSCEGFEANRSDIWFHGVLMSSEWSKRMRTFNVVKGSRVWSLSYLLAEKRSRREATTTISKGKRPTEATNGFMGKVK